MRFQLSPLSPSTLIYLNHIFGYHDGQHLWRSILNHNLGENHGPAIGVVIDGCPPGLGEFVFEKLNRALAGALMGIGAVKGVDEMNRTVRDIVNDGGSITDESVEESDLEEIFPGLVGIED